MADDRDNFTSQLYLLLVVFGSGALIIALYYCIKVACSDGGRRAGPRHRLPIARTYISRRGEPPSSTENSMADLIQAHKYQKGAGTLVGEDDSRINTCAVCLCDFEEGEELRTLPECMHSFHVPCIDMWLYSHSTCPVCRTHAIMSLSQVLQTLSHNHSPTLPPQPTLPPPPPAALQHGSMVIPDLGGNILV